jgi:octaprenyl-diphosphate synthase
MLLLDAQHRDLSQKLAVDLAEVEARFAAELHSDLPCVNDLVRHIERYRGKMLRPMLVLACGRATAEADPPITHAHRTLATVVEMVHMATLVHDDILDEADTRRRGATVNALRGNEAAVMLGDYLISHAYHLCSSLDSQVAARLIAATTNTVCEGELLQLANRYNWSVDEQTYQDIIRRKTGALCGVACRLGAMASGADRATCEGLAEFGDLLGCAFQIIDDVLDLVGNERVVGKSLGKDLEKGKLTLPLIHYLEIAAPAERQQMMELLRTAADDRAGRIIKVLRSSEAVDYARNRAEQLIDRARRRCGRLADTDARRLLQAMADAVLTRQA